MCFQPTFKKQAAAQLDVQGCNVVYGSDSIDVPLVMLSSVDDACARGVQVIRLQILQGCGFVHRELGFVRIDGANTADCLTRSQCWSNEESCPSTNKSLLGQAKKFRQLMTDRRKRRTRLRNSQRRFDLCEAIYSTSDLGTRPGWQA